MYSFMLNIDIAQKRHLTEVFMYQISHRVGGNRKR